MKNKDSYRLFQLAERFGYKDDAWISRNRIEIGHHSFVGGHMCWDEYLDYAYDYLLELLVKERLIKNLGE